MLLKIWFGLAGTVISLGATREYLNGWVWRKKTNFIDWWLENI
ncbi:MAG TPA: hypothetical protein PKI14_15205 [Fervidobacterium sp.]|nr:hypothetical protein [Fervidobacterium sp.]HUM44290.1 hypothetical protein [Fervidobacterium sp.]